MNKTADCIIIGGGVIGTSIAYYLTQKGVGRVVLLEREAVCSGTTGRSGGIVRQHYSNDFTIRMARECLHIFAHFDALVGGDCGFTKTGLLVTTNEQGKETLHDNTVLQQQLGVDTRLLRPEEITDVVPGYNPEQVALACYEPDAGVADPMATASCFAQRARELGAAIREGTTVRRIVTQGERIEGVETIQGERISAPVVVLAANVWSVALAYAIGIELPIVSTRHPMLALRRPQDFGGRMDMHAVCFDTVHSTYFRPDLGGITLVGMIEDVHTVSNPDHYQEGLTEAEINYLRVQARISLPALGRAVPRGGWAGIYDDTPDYHPILDRLHAYEGLYCAAGFSGHGFKLSPIVGQWMTQLITTGTKPDDMHHFAYERFAQGSIIRPRYSSSVLA